ncbi:transposase [Nostoc sp. FACHB-87]|nr:transposase [Nostoc sp. FACHB-87]
MTRRATAVCSSRETLSAVPPGGNPQDRTASPRNCLKKGSKRKHQKTGLNRSLLDVGIGNLISLIKYKLDECNGVFVYVPLKIAPSQTCPRCGHKKKKELSQRVHNCEVCNFVADRDVAAAMVMLNYAKGLGTSLSNADAEPLSKNPQHCGGFRKVQQVKRLKPRDVAKRSP